MLTDLKQEFLHPSEEFSPIPFWFWNDELSEEELDRQMREFKDKGVDGFVIHPRLGLPESIGYLTEEYFHYVRHAVERAAQWNMKVVLYDEAMYPSGSCHGKVVQENGEFASRGLLMRAEKEGNPRETLVAEAAHDGKLYYFYEAFSGGTIRGVHYGEDDGEAHAPASTDLLNPEAVACFIRLTHEAYYQQLKEYFGTTVIGMFTDEPNILGRCSKKGMIPWTAGFLEELKKQGGTEEDLYWLFAEKDNAEGDGARERYESAVYERMSRAYYKQISDWCKAHSIAMTGHPEKSTDIGYLQYFDIPCQDIVWRFVAPEDGKAIRGEHSTMGKCSSDSARHRGKRRNGNECFGCCGAADDPYRFTKEDMKWYLDWLFVRGVNLVYPHAFYYSLRDKRREERPPEVGMHCGFWEEYRQVTDYMKRMCSLLTDSVNQAKVAILCQREKLSWEMAKPLFEHQIEFNYLEEELLPSCRMEEGCLLIQQQRYELVITDGVISDRSRAILEQFEQAGGRVLFWESDMEGKKAETLVSLDYRFSPISEDLRCTYLKKDGVDFMILVNEGEDDLDVTLHLAHGAAAEVWDAWEGKTWCLTDCPTEDKAASACGGVSLDASAGECKIHLSRRESRILILC